MPRIDLTEDRVVTIGRDYPDCVTCYNDFRDNYDLRGKRVRVLTSVAVPPFALAGKLWGQMRASDFEFVGCQNAVWNAPAENAINGVGDGSPLIFVSDEARFGIAGLTLRNPTGFGVAVGQGEVSVRDCWFGAHGGAALDVCGSKSAISVSGFSTLLFEDTGAFAVAEHGDIFIVSNIYVSGGPLFRNAFIQADLGGYIDLTGYKLVEPGAARGVKFKTFSGSNIENNGGSLPGNMPGQIYGGFYQ